MKISHTSIPFLWSWVFVEIKLIFSTTPCHLFFKGEQFSKTSDFAHFSLTEEGLNFPLFKFPYSLQDVEFHKNSLKCGEWEFVLEKDFIFYALSSVKSNDLNRVLDTDIYHAYHNIEFYVKTANFKLNGVYRATGNALQAIHELDIDDIVALSKNFSKNYRIHGIALIQMYKPKRKVEVDVIEDILANSPEQARIECEALLAELGDFIQWLSYKSKSTKLK